MHSVNKIKVSIIVPVYKVEKYIEQCIESVLNQTYANWELILINDGSPDSSPSICKRYSSADKRIVYLEKKNEGVSSARNCGLAMASGKWVLFLDGDDMLYPPALQILIHNIERSRADILQFNFNRYGDANIADYQCSELYEPKEYVKTNLCSVAACGSFIKLSIIREHGLRFDETLKQGEDQLFILDCLRHCKAIQKTTATLYYYRINMASAVHNPRPEDIITSICKFTQYKNKFPLLINIIDRALGNFIYKLTIFSNITPKELYNLYKTTNVRVSYQNQKSIRLMLTLCKLNFHLGFYVAKTANWFRSKISNIHL